MREKERERESEFHRKSCAILDADTTNMLKSVCICILWIDLATSHSYYNCEGCIPNIEWVCLFVVNLEPGLCVVALLFIQI